MKTFKEFKQLKESFSLMSEDVYIQDGQLVFDYNKTKTDGISTKFGKESGSIKKGTKKKFVPFTKKTADVLDHTIHSVYFAKGTSSTDIMKAIKKQNNIRIKDDNYLQFINRSAFYMATKIIHGKFDTIVAPDSSSPLLIDILDNLKGRLSGVKIFTDSFKKVTDINKIKVDRDHPKITPTLADKMEKEVQRIQKKGYFAMKSIDVKFRKFLSGYLELIPSKIKRKYFTDQRVLIFDDMIASGTTMKEMIKQIELYSPSTLEGATIFKSQ